MSHECEECGESFDTLSRLRLHDCSPDSPAEEPAPEAASPGEEKPNVEAEYPDLVGDLPGLVDDAREGDLTTLYRAIAEYETVLAEAPGGSGSDPSGPYHDVRWAYYEPLADGLDAAARANGWEVLTEFVDAYDPREQDELPEVAHIIGNAVGRSIVRTRLSDGVEAIPPEALAYLGAIPEYVDEHALTYEESYTYGWGIGHPEHSVSDRLRALADAEHKWVTITLKTAFYADQYAALDALERLVTDESLTGTVQRISFEVDVTRYYLGAVSDLEREFLGPHVPPYWDWEEEVDYSFELDPEVKQQIRRLVHETGVVEDLPADWTLGDLDPGPLSDIEDELLSSGGQ